MQNILYKIKNTVPQSSLNKKQREENVKGSSFNIILITNEEIKKLTTKKISFSPLTFPHQLFRVILLEQIYRSFKILNNETYHK